MIDSRSLEEKILGIWADYVGGDWRLSLDPKKGWATIKLHAPEDTFEYKNIKEAADACLVTIAEWLKEV